MRYFLLCGVTFLMLFAGSAHAEDVVTPEQARETLRRAVDYFTTKVATEGGYAWRYTADLKQREGERAATNDMIWIQPPGTPSVGLAYLNVYQQTRDKHYLECARQTATALVKGQLTSGGWDYSISFDIPSREKIAYRKPPHAPRDAAKAANVTTLDDDNTQSAVRLLMRVDQALESKDEAIHEASLYALDKLVEVQYPNGAWPQRFSAPPEREKFPVVAASFPQEWSRTFPNVKYNSFYTFNDNAMGDMIEVMLEAGLVYQSSKYTDAAKHCGDFMILAQLPEPQPAWAQQYDAEMHPAWARKFEPPSVTGGESQSVIESLMLLYEASGEEKFLKPIGRALDYLDKSRLPDGRLARFYEFGTNRPMYFTKEYELTYDNSDMPTHYAFIVPSRVERLRPLYEKLLKNGPPKSSVMSQLRRRPSKVNPSLAGIARAAVTAIDSQGRWLEPAKTKTLKVSETEPLISTATFIRNIEALAAVAASGK
ncbi:MAG: hypothetical protein JSS27_04310 [Planctomycetes bacterium]|nr:hypothetical protein [Planctomycetota bacterium]